MTRPIRAMTTTQLPKDVPESVRQVLQGFAQTIDQLVQAFAVITPANSVITLTNGAPAGNFNGVFLIGTITAANTSTLFGHKLGRTPVGAFEILALPQANQAKVPVAQVASAIALLTSNGTQVTLTSTAANRQFVMILF